MGNSGGRHHAARASKVALPVAGAAGVIAAAGAAVIALTPTLSASPELLADANVYYAPGTKIGDVKTDQQSQEFVAAMLQGSKGQTVDPGTVKIIDYPGGFWPISTGGLTDPTYSQSVADGLATLDGKPSSGDTVVGYSQGAVVATEYKRENPDTGINYVLIENPNRPNGGILERFNGLNIPILNISFNGATPTTGGSTVDISRQYDGWSDFPAYPLNLLADANAIAGIVYLHGGTQGRDSTAVSNIDKTDPMYYQQHGDTTYYLIPTEQLPILMPFNGIVPKPVLDALDPPLRALIELGYDRSDYGAPTPAKLLPAIHPIDLTKDLTDATARGVATGLAESGAPVPAVSPSVTSNSVATPAAAAAPKPDVLKQITPKLPKVKTSSPLSSIGVKTPTGTKNLAARAAGPKKPQATTDHDAERSTD